MFSILLPKDDREGTLAVEPNANALCDFRPRRFWQIYFETKLNYLTVPSGARSVLTNAKR
jgi:hypothetical protein